MRRWRRPTGGVGICPATAVGAVGVAALPVAPVPWRGEGVSLTFRAPVHCRSLVSMNAKTGWREEAMGVEMEDGFGWW